MSDHTPVSAATAIKTIWNSTRYLPGHTLPKVDNQKSSIDNLPSSLWHDPRSCSVQ
jgi:hypothetical protein